MARWWLAIGCVYLLICSTNYLFANLTCGWFTVMATSCLFCFSVVFAIRRQSYFAGGFAIGGFLWLSSWLGLPVEPPPLRDTPYLMVRELRLRVVDWMTIGEPRPLHTTGIDVYDLYGSSIVTQHSLPEKRNILRLFVCLTSLVSGVGIGAVARHFLARQQSSAADLPSGGSES